jgi:hypothetical protein
MSGPAEGDLPASLTLEEAFRAAYFMIEKYTSLEADPAPDFLLMELYMMSDPARWSDWLDSVGRALDNPNTAVEYLYDWRQRFGKPDDAEA